MKLTGYDQKRRMVEWAMEIKQLAQKRGDKKGAEIIQHEIDKLLSGKFVLTVMGQVKRGKSTFCNAFLGRGDDLLDPVDKLPCSSVIIKFVKSSEERAVVYFNDGREPERITYSRIREYVTEEFNKENSKNVESVEVFGRFPTLDEDLVLIDTPGAGSIHKHHDAILLKYIPQSDAVVFLVTSKAPLVDDEVELLKKLKDADIKKIFFAINKADTTEAADLDSAVAHNMRVLADAGISVDRMFRISAREAMRGNLASSGWQEMLSEISGYLSREKNNILTANFISNVLKVAQGLECGLRLEIAAGSTSEDEILEEIENLKARRSEMKVSQDAAEKRFLSTWRMLVEEFDQSLDSARKSVERRVAEKVESRWAISAGGLVKELPSFMDSAMREELEPYSSKFESGAKEATEKLKVEYPSVMIASGDSGLILGSSVRSSSLLKGTIGATVAAGLGGSAVAAATSSAALITTQVATTAAAPSLVTAAGGFLSSLGFPILGNTLSFLGTGTAATTTTVTAVAPWAAIAGPVGWTLIGIGALCVPVSFYVSKLEQKDKILKVALENIASAFREIREKKIKWLKSMGEGLIEGYKAKVLGDLAQISDALDSAMKRKKGVASVPVEELNGMLSKLNDVCARSKVFLKGVGA